MLKFIISTVDDLKTVFNDFKTSHVKVYHDGDRLEIVEV